jgi:hypothetical protein
MPGPERWGTNQTVAVLVAGAAAAGSRVANIAAIAGASAGLPHPGRAANEQATMREARVIIAFPTFLP